MTPDLLRRCGEALYGPRWQVPLAHDLLVETRTIRRWCAGDAAIPDGVRRDLIQLIEERIAALTESVAELR